MHFVQVCVTTDDFFLPAQGQSVVNIVVCIADQFLIGQVLRWKREHTVLHAYSAVCESRKISTISVTLSR